MAMIIMTLEFYTGYERIRFWHLELELLSIGLLFQVVFSHQHWMYLKNVYRNNINCLPKIHIPKAVTCASYTQIEPWLVFNTSQIHTPDSCHHLITRFIRSLKTGTHPTEIQPSCSTRFLWLIFSQTFRRTPLFIWYVTIINWINYSILSEG